MIVKRRVLYIGSSVPLETQEGLEAIQQPLRDRYPSGDETQVQGIDAYVSILSTGIQLQYIEDGNLVVFFPIASMTLCAAVRHTRNINAGTGEAKSQFLSLSNPVTRTGNNSKSPAIFATITRRTKGRKILECHGFLCASDNDAMDLVRATSIVDRQARGLPPPVPAPAPQPIPTEVPGQTFRTGMSFRNSNGAPPGSFTTVNSTPRTMNGTGTARTDNGTANGHVAPPNVRLMPGYVNQPRDAPPEFYEPPPAQGYFYSSDKAEAKTFNIEKTGDDGPPSPPTSDREPNETTIPPTIPVSQPPQSGPLPKPIYMMAGNPPTAFHPPPHQLAPEPPQAGPAPAPQPIPYPQPMPNMRRPVYVHPGAGTMPHPYLRHRFFSPPPPHMRPFPPGPGPFMMPPPPPGMAPFPPRMPPPHMFVRRPRMPRSLSSSSRSNSRSPSPKNVETNLKNGDFGSDSSISNYRPRTPPRDYDVPRERMSRREEYERKREKSRHRRPPAERPPYVVYGYPGQPGYPGPDFQPFPGHGRSSSVPPHLRYAQESTKKGKKSKKAKKNKKKHGPTSQFSMQSYGYASEIPRNSYPGWEGHDNPSQVRKPRDFRREENQFMNEKSFSKSIKAEFRQSEAGENYPTAYELNEPSPRPAGLDDNKVDDIGPMGDFTMY